MLADHALVGGKLHGIHAQEIFQPFSAVVAVATITGSHEDWRCAVTADRGSCSEWAMSAPPGAKPMHHWQLADVQPLATTVPAKGQPGLWKPDPQLIEAVEIQL